MLGDGHPVHRVVGRGRRRRGSGLFVDGVVGGVGVQCAVGRGVGGVVGGVLLKEHVESVLPSAFLQIEVADHEDGVGAFDDVVDAERGVVPRQNGVHFEADSVQQLTAREGVWTKAARFWMRLWPRSRSRRFGKQRSMRSTSRSLLFCRLRRWRKEHVDGVSVIDAL